MKEFNWEGFRSKEFAVHCDTEEEAREFIKEAYSKGIKWMASDAKETYWDVAGKDTCYYGSNKLFYGHIDDCDIKIIEWRNYDMKSFREVIRDIKEGEVWESENRIISVEHGSIIIEDKFEGEGKVNLFRKGVKYRLKQQPVTFEEVLNSDKRCRVEHELLKDKYYSLYDEFDYILSEISNNFKTEETKEIIKNGKWYLEP